MDMPTGSAIYKSLVMPSGPAVLPFFCLPHCMAIKTIQFHKWIVQIHLNWFQMDDVLVPRFDLGHSALEKTMTRQSKSHLSYLGRICVL